MSDKIYRNFIYTERETNRVLAVKRTYDFDLSFESSDFKTDQILSSDPIFLSEPELHTYSIGEGFQKISPVAGMELERIRLLQRKIEILQWVRTNVCLVEQDIRQIFKSNYADSFAVDPIHYQLLHHFLMDERSLLLKKCRTFFQSFAGTVEGSRSLEELNLHYRELMNSCNIGVYTALKRGKNQDEID